MPLSKFEKLFLRLLTWLIFRFRPSDYVFGRFVHVYRDRLNGEIEKYPSIFNEGYLHIGKSIDLIIRLNLQAGLIVDVGAAGGLVTAMYAQRLPGTRIYSFEPISQSYSELVELTKRYPNVTVINKALGSRPAAGEIHISTRITASSLYEPNIADDNNFITENLVPTSRQAVTISTLDDELRTNEIVSVLKLDVQGYELEALRGAIRTLQRTHIVVVELSNHPYYGGGAKYWEVDEFLRTKGFELLDFIPSLRDNGKVLEWDSIYRNAVLPERS